MGKSGDPEGEASTNTLSKPRDPKMQAAKVHMLNGSSKDFELHRGSDGDVLFTMVSTDLSIEEREYFSLCFYDEQGMRHWLYNDKKILRQLKGLPWEFSFEVKFYPTAPSTLNDDNARCNLFLQLRKDVATGRLPATIPTHALLAACVAQAEYGDADTSAEYEKYLREAQFVQTLKEQQNLDKVKELHREQKGLTPAEAELKYLETCKQLSMYGVFVFNAVDKQSQDVLIGICASGINIYKDTIRMHRFSWQNIVKISYRNNTFSVKLKAGELDKKKETTLVYKVHDYLYAKRVWKCGVEHHTFFRLIQPEDKPKGGLFRWGSTRFRYHGRTQFQTKMASQMFDNSAAGTVPRASGRLTQSCDNVNKENIPVNDKSATLGREGKVPSPTTSPGISYEINSSKRAGSSNGKVGSSLDSDDELVYTPVETPTSAAYYLSERSSLRSPYSSGAVSPYEWSAPGREVVYRHSSARRNLFGRDSEGNSGAVRLVSFHEPVDQTTFVPNTSRVQDLNHIPINQSVQLYHQGFYNEPPREPTVPIVRYAPRNGVPAVDRLEPVDELNLHPIRFFVNLHHSGERDRVRINRVRHIGSEDTAEPHPANYAFGSIAEDTRTELGRTHDMVPANIREYSDVYYTGKYDDKIVIERPKYRLIARVLPGSENSATSSMEESRDTHADISMGSEVRQTRESKPVYAQTTERYEGPLESVERRDDLANLPLEHHPRVPYVTKTSTVTTRVVEAKPSSVEHEPEEETRRFRYIARIRHDGDEDIVDKEQVRPELYGLPSTSYDGPLEDTARDEDLEPLPIGDHAQVYHSGQSWQKTKPAEQHRVETAKVPKTAVLHVKSPVKTSADDEKPEIRLVARVLPAEEDDSRDAAAGKARDSSSSKFGFFKSAGKKSKTAATSSTTAEPSKTYALTTERYEGPLESVERRDDLANLPLEHHPRVPYVTKTSTVTTRVVEAKPSSVEHEPEEETRRFRYIARIRHDGDEDIVDKEQVRPELYGLPSTSYDGPLEDTARDEDLEPLPIGDHAQVYHSGQSWQKTKPAEQHRVETAKVPKTAVLHVKSPVKTPADDEKPEIRLVARVLPAEEDDSRDAAAGKARDSSSSKFGFFKSAGKKSKTAATSSKTAEPSKTYALTTERYEGPLESVERRDDLANLPLEHHPRVPYVTKTSTVTTRVVEAKPSSVEHEPEEETRRFRYIARIRHDGDEDIVDKEQVRPELYGLPSTSYDGPLEDTARDEDLEPLPIGDHAQVYHSGQSWQKTKPAEQHRVETAKVPKTAVLHVKSPVKTPVDDEKPEIRLVARVLPAEEDDSRDAAAGKARDSSSSKFGFFKSAGKKSKTVTTSSTTAEPSKTYALTTERYEGPLESVERRDDLANLPLEHHPRVPYVTKTSTVTTRVVEAKPSSVEHEPEEETRRFRYIARIRHDGDEDIVDKEQVRPELYGLPSTSYDGPLEDTARDEDLEPLPIGDHAQVYHSGQSWQKTKPAEQHRVETAKVPKTAVLHVKSPVKTPVDDEKPEIRLVARVLPAEEDDSRDAAAGKARDSSSSKFGFFKSAGKKSKTVTTSSTTAEPSKTYALTTERYEGPLESVERRDDLANLPLEHHPRVPYVTKTSTVTTRVVEAKPSSVEHEPEEETRRFRYIARIRHDGDEDIVDKEQVRPELYGLPSTSYDGPLEDTARDEDLEPLPIGDHAQVYHSGQSWQKTKPAEQHRVETAKVPKTAVLHVKSPVKTPVDDEKPEIRLVARVLPAEEDDSRDAAAGKARDSSSSKFGFFKSAGKKSKTVTTSSTTAEPSKTYALTTERYEGPLESVERRDDLANLPLEHHPRVPYVTKTSTVTTRVVEAKPSSVEHEPEEETRRFRYIARIRHDGDEDIVDKEQVRPELYGLPSTSYDGPLEDTARDEDLEPLPIGDHAQVYHSGQSWQKTKPAEQHRVETAKVPKTAVLLVKSPVKTPVDDEKPEIRLVARVLPAEEDDSRDAAAGKARDSSSSKFGFFKSAGKKSKTAATSSTTAEPSKTYALTTERYEGPLESVERRDDLANLPLEHHPRVPYVTKTSTVTTRVVEAKPSSVEHEPEEETRRFRYIARIRHDGDEDIVDKEQVRPELYGLPSTSYDGPLEDTARDEDLEPLPIGDHAQVYHSGQSWQKTKPAEQHRVETAKVPKTAVLHVKSPVKTPVDDEKPEIRLVARVLPAEEDDSRDAAAGKARDSSSSKFGFFKSAGKKSKTAATSSTTAEPSKTYALTTERYEGPLESVERRDDLANLPLEHHPRVPYVTKTSTVTTRVVEAKPSSVEHEPEEETRRFRYIARIRHDGDEDIVDKEQVRPELYGLPSTSYDGPLEDTARDEDLEPLPIGDHAQVYHSGQSWQKTKPAEQHRVETAKVPKTAVLLVKSPVKTPVDDEKPEIRLVARVLPAEEDDSRDAAAGKARDSSSSKFGFFKSAGKKSKTVTTSSTTAEPSKTYALTTERYEGPLESVERRDDLANLPLEHHPRVPYVTKTSTVTTRVVEAKPSSVEHEPEEETRRFRYIARIRHDGDEDIVDKEQVRPELYGLPSTSYDGPLEDTARDEDLEPLPIGDHAQVYHSGQSWQKTKPAEQHRVETAKVPKTAVLLVKSPVKTPVDDEKPEIRLVARVLPAEEDDSRDAAAGKARDSSSSKFGFFKSAGKKSKTVTTSSTTAEPSKTYALTTERYEGPLESVERRDDLANLPLEHHPRVPYVTKTSTVTTRVVEAKPSSVEHEPEEETRRFRYIARIRHDGDEDIVDKEQVRPELYGLPSTSYDGPLEDTARDEDLEPLPIGDHAQVYHSGQSWQKTKPAEQHRVETAKVPKTAVLHVKSPVKTPVDDEKPEIRLVARVLPAEEDDSRDAAAGKARDSSSSKFGFFKSAGKKSKTAATSSTTAEPSKTYALTTERYEGPLESVERRDDLANLPLEHHPRVPYVTKTSTVTTRVVEAKPSSVEHEPEEETRRFRYIARIRHDGDEDIVDKEQVRPELYGLPSTSYDGPLEDTARDEDLEPLPIGDHAQVYHSGQSWQKTKPAEQHRVETAKVPKTAVLLVKSPVKTPVDDEKPEIRLVARVLPAEEDDSRDAAAGKARDSSSSKFGFFKSAGKKSKTVTTSSTTAEPSKTYALTTERYEGPLESVERRDDLANLPLEHHPRVPYVTKTSTVTTRVVEAKPSSVEHEPEEETRRFRYIARIRHDGDEDIVDKEQVRPELYGLPSTSYDGPLEDTARDEDLEPLPIGDHAQVYHSGQSWQKTKPAEQHRVETAKVPKTAVLLVKSPVKTPVDDEKPEIRLVARVLPAEEDDSRDAAAGKARDSSSSKFGFFKSAGKKSKTVTTSSTTAEPSKTYALTTERYEGPLESVERRDDLANLPLEHHPRVPYVTKTSTVTTRVVEAKPSSVEHEPEEETRRFRYIARIRHDGDEDIVDKEQVRPELYGLPSTSYDGPLEDTARDEDLEPLPIGDHAQVYHSGQSWQKTKPAEQHRVETAKVPKTAVLLVKSPVKTPVDDEKPEIRLVARVLPAEEDDSRDAAAGKARDSSSSKFGFFKSAGKKSKTVTTSSTTAEPSKTYALTTERYEGPLESVERRDDLANLPLEHHPRVPYVTKTSTVTTRVVEAKPSSIEHEPEEETRRFRYIARIRHDGDEDIVDKEQVRPELYGLPSTSYDGPLEDTARDEDLEPLPIGDHAQVYHSGQSCQKTKPAEQHRVETAKVPKTAVLHVKSPVKTPVDDEKPEIRLVARVLPAEEDDSRDAAAGKARDSSSSKFGFFKSAGKKSKTVTTSSTTAEPSKTYALTTERYEGPLESVERRDDLANLPLEHHLRVAKAVSTKSEITTRYQKDHNLGSLTPYHSEGTTADGQQWIEVRVERRVELQLEPVFYLTGAGLGAVSEDEGGLIFSATPPPMAPAGRSFLSRLGFKTKKSKKAKGEREADSSDSSSSDEEHRAKVVPVVETASPTIVEPNSSGKLVRCETKEQSYRLSGEGRSSGFNPEHPSLSTTIAEAERLNQRSPRLEHAERTITVRALAPMPVSFEESGQPQTTVATWQERTVLPDDVTVEYDEHGNRITRTVKTSQVKHTVQKQTFQNYVVPDEGDPSSTVERSCEQLTPLGLSTHTGPIVDTHSRSVVYETSSPAQGDEGLGEFVSSKTVTSGNRTIETITYKTERDGIIETHVEHRVTIHSDSPIDHDAELSAAIAEATQMNPDMTVEKIEVRQETST